MIIDHAFLERLWYSKQHPLALVLRPIGWLYALTMALRRAAYQCALLPRQHVPVPVIVVGNIAVGGTGKTPLVIAIAGFLAAQGWQPGIVCRGYGGKARQWPQQVRADSDAAMVGDEAVLMARRAQCPVSAAGSARAMAAQQLVEHHGCDVIVSDDGLQHLAMRRDIEIVVIDAQRRHGNGQCLPAGPLREPVSRLRTVDMLVANTNPSAGARRGEFAMTLVAGPLVAVADNKQRKALDSFTGERVHAVAGIGNPGRFFRLLQALHIKLVEHAFADHHRFCREDLDFGDSAPVLMTEKDAVKCANFAAPNHWYVPVTAQLPDAFFMRLAALLSASAAQRDGRRAGEANGEGGER